MSRPIKPRRVCSLPQIDKYGPVNFINDNIQIVIMSVEEIEVIRLMDLVKLDQEKCAEVMGVARSTVQRIYNDARSKIADSIVNGKILKIQGGNYKVCDGFSDIKCRRCYMGHHRQGRF